MRTWVALVVLALGLAGEARAGEPRPGWFSVRLPVIAVVHDELFAGEAIGHLDRTGTIEIRSVLDANSKCAGEFHYTGLTSGMASMRCDDGTAALLAFQALGLMSGYGYGDTARGTASFTFGLDPEDAIPHLRLPHGKKLGKTAEGLRLEPR